MFVQQFLIYQMPIKELKLTKLNTIGFRFYPKTIADNAGKFNKSWFHSPFSSCGIT